MKRLTLGLLVTLALVLGSSLLTWRTGVSYEHFTWAAYAGGAMYPDTEIEVPGGCSDGEDNDIDGPIDCADSDCRLSVVCNAPAPAMSTTGIAVLLTLLASIGFVTLLRRRQHD